MQQDLNRLMANAKLLLPKGVLLGWGLSNEEIRKFGKIAPITAIAMASPRVYSPNLLNPRITKDMTMPFLRIINLSFLQCKCVMECRDGQFGIFFLNDARNLDL